MVNAVTLAENFIFRYSKYSSDFNINLH